MRTLQPRHYFCGLLWFLVNACCVVYLSTTKHIEFSSNILALLSDPIHSSPSALQLGSAYLEHGSKTLRFLIRGSDEEAVLSAAEDFHELLSTLPGVAIQQVPNEEKMLASIATALSPYRAELLTPEQAELLKQGPEAVALSIQEKLYSPMASFYSRFLPYDPFLFLPESILALQIQPPSTVTTTSVPELDGMLHLHPNEHLAFSLIARLHGEPLRLDEQQAIITALTEAVQNFQDSHSSIEIRWSGIPRFAQSSATRLQGDISSLSTLGSMFAVCLLYFCFRSLAAVFYCSLSVLSGILVGTTVVVLCNGSIHLITLGIGISLMGACIDYSLHFLSECYFGSAPGKPIATLNARNKVARPVILGACTSALAFLALSASGFPGLRELSLFALGSLSASAITVLTILPLLVRGTAVAMPLSLLRLSSAPARFSHVLHSMMQRQRAFASILALGISVLALWSLTHLRINDDIRALQSPAPVLLESEEWIQQETAQPRPSGYVIRSADDKPSLQRSLYRTHHDLQEAKAAGLLSAAQSVFGVTPPVTLQAKRREQYTQFLEQFSESLRTSLGEIGFDGDTITSALQSPMEAGDSRQPLALDTILGLFPESAQGLLGIQEYQLDQGGPLYVGVIPVYGVSSADSLMTFLRTRASKDASSSGRQESLDYFNPTRDISTQFHAYRNESTFLVSLAYLVIIFFLFSRYRKLALRQAVLPLLGSTVATFAILGLSGQSISFFSILAVILVLGLGVDYAIFMLEAQRAAGYTSTSASHARAATADTQNAHSTASVSLAVLVSGVSTIASFGLLAISDTAVLYSIGVTVSVGVLFSMIFCLLGTQHHR